MQVNHQIIAGSLRWFISSTGLPVLVTNANRGQAI